METELNNKISRRNFIKAATVFAGAATITGCNISFSSSNRPSLPRTVATAAPHNCGGACALRAEVINDVVKRIFTDESKKDENITDKLLYGGKGTAIDAPQERACLRCHAQKGWLYSTNRLLYPLKQTKERGNLSGFVRISWNEALDIIRENIENIRNRYGYGAFHDIYSSGSSGPKAKVSVYAGGAMGYRQDYSFPALTHVANFALGEEYIPRGNSRLDGANADEIICWSHNVGETFMGTNSMWYLTQFKELGVKVKIVDHRMSKTANTLINDIDNDFMSPANGTDAAVIFAMMYSMLTDYYDDFKALWGATTDAELKENLGKYVHGFFDDRNVTPYNSNVDPELFSKVYTTKQGTSLSAYVFGNLYTLVWRGLNESASAYPNDIGYNVWSYSNKRDMPPRGVSTRCYGQVPKTPEWAEKISGVPAAQIRSWARALLTKKTTIWLGGGFQRTTEAEQPVLAMVALMGITKQFGESGRACGWHFNGRGTDCIAGKSWTSGVNVNRYRRKNELSKFFTDNPDAQYQYIAPDTLSIDYEALNFYDTDKLSFPDNTSKFCRTQIPVATWLDAVEATNSPKVKDVDGVTDVWPSRWNDGQIKRLPVPWKAIFNMAGNILVNQNGDPNHAVSILKDKSKLEFIATFDVVMTASAQYSDLILPCAMPLETDFDTAPFWESSDTSKGVQVGAAKYLIANKVVTPPGEAVSALMFQAMLAKKFGCEEEYYNGMGNAENFEANIVRANYESNSERVKRMSFDEWKKIGVYRADPNKQVMKFWGSDFRADPAANPLPTVSGRIEVYCHSMMEDYEARHYQNLDANQYLRNGARIPSASTPSYYESRGRYVYPIPMYIPAIEGKHADNSHPDVLGLARKGFDKVMNTWHMIYRAHSTFNSNPMLNDFYKKDANNNYAALDSAITNASASNSAPQVWHDGVYEPIWINPETRYSGTNAKLNEGDVVVVESLRGRIKAVVHTTQLVRLDTIMIGQGSCYSPDESGLDVGGCANTLMSQRPSRIGQGMTQANDCRVKIYKA